MADIEKRIERLEYIARNSRWGDLLEQADRKCFDKVDSERTCFDGVDKSIIEAPWLKIEIRWSVVLALVSIFYFIKLIIK